MITPELVALLVTAGSIGFFHTLFGPDHYLPFIVMAEAGKWSRAKTAWITFLCGLGHVGSSVLLGLIGVVLGISVTRLEGVEAGRGSIAAWGLIAFGLVFFVWGMRRALKGKPHTHSHVHRDGTVHEHEHQHEQEHAHPHTEKSSSVYTPWALFLIFVLGPCEPLIPILMYPAAKMSWLGVILVVLVFGAATIGTMLGVVLVSSYGARLLPLRKLEVYTHAIAGATICLCGVAIEFLGL